METKTTYQVIKYNQRLISGTWDSPDCVWVWEREIVEFKTRKEAEAYMRELELSKDIPHAELVKHVERYANGEYIDYGDTRIFWKD